MLQPVSQRRQVLEATVVATNALLLGHDPIAIERIWDRMYRMQVHGRKGTEMMALSVVDCALWDLKGRYYNTPVYRLLGGARDRLPAYASTLTLDSTKAFLELADDVKTMMEARKLEMGHARALLGLPTARQQVEAATAVASKGLSVRETEAMVRRMLKPQPAKPAKPAQDPDIRALEGELGDKLGAKVQIQSSAGGKGKLVIAYNSLDELEGILGHFR